MGIIVGNTVTYLN